VQVVASPDAKEVLVQTLVDGGSAKAAGLRTNDIITDVDQRPTIGAPEFVQFVKRLRAGDQTALTIKRDGNPQTVRVPIRARPFESVIDVDVRSDAVAVDGAFGERS
jgi:S1-C subfamily serine protease